MKKYRFYKKIDNDGLLNGEAYTVSFYGTDKILVSQFVDFKSAGLTLVGRSNEAFWGLARVIESIKNKGFLEV